MKSFLAVSLVTLLTSAALAGSVNFDMRSDYRSQNFNDAAVNAGAGKNNSSFMLQTGRVDFKGNLNEDTSYRLRVRVSGKKQTDVDKRDNTNSTLDYAYVSQKIADNFTLQVGKLASDMGGFEGITSGPDLYLASEAYLGTTGMGGSTFHSYGTALGATTASMGLTGSVTEYYITGVKAIYTMGNNELNIQVADVDAGVGRGTAAGATDVLESGKFAQSSNLVGVVYKGSFMDKSLSAIASYHTQKTSSLGGTLDTKANWTSVGLQYQMDAILAQLDYSIDSYTGIVGTTNPNDKLSSIVANFRYTMNDNWTFGAKYVSSQEAIDSATGTATVTSFTNKYSSYGLVTEFKPKKADNFRYHLAYNSKTMKPDAAGADDRMLTELIAGVRISADFLK